MTADFYTALLIAFYCFVVLSPIALLVVLSALRAASRDDRLLSKTKLFKQIFSESRTKDD